MEQKERLDNAARKRFAAVSAIFLSFIVGFDIAIMISKPVDGLERVRLETNLSNVMGKDVDLVIFGRVSPLLQHQILRYGRLVYEANPKERVRQETVARRQYLESLFLYRIIDKDKANGG